MTELVFIRDLLSGDLCINAHLRCGACADFGDTHPVPVNFMILINDRGIYIINYATYKCP